MWPCRRTVVVIINLLRRDEGVHTFQKGIGPKVKVIVWLGFELAYLDFAVKYIRHWTHQLFITDYCVTAGLLRASDFFLIMQKLSNNDPSIDS